MNVKSSLLPKTIIFTKYSKSNNLAIITFRHQKCQSWWWLNCHFWTSKRWWFSHHHYHLTQMQTQTQPQNIHFFVESLIPLFWTSGDICLGFQSQGRSLACFLACVILRFISGVTSAHFIEVGMARVCWARDRDPSSNYELMRIMYNLMRIRNGLRDENVNL